MSILYLYTLFPKQFVLENPVYFQHKCNKYINKTRDPFVVQIIVDWSVYKTHCPTFSDTMRLSCQSAVFQSQQEFFFYWVVGLLVGAQNSSLSTVGWHRALYIPDLEISKALLGNILCHYFSPEMTIIPIT